MKNEDYHFTKIAVAQYLQTHNLKFGEGLEVIYKSDEAFRIIDGQDVFVNGYNYSGELPEPFNKEELFKFGEFYEPAIMIGMPSHGGDVELWIDPRYHNYWVMWTAIKLDDGITGDSMPQVYDVICWTPRLENETILEAGFRMFTAWALKMDYVDENSFYCDLYLESDYRTEINASTNCEVVFAAIRDTVYKDEKDLESVIDHAPASLKDHILKRSVIL
jgi:hypothetical protein